MKNRRAINILKELIDDLSNEKNHNHTWLMKLHTYIDKFFGEKSYQSDTINNFRFLNNKDYPPSIVNQRLGELIAFLTDCIHIIKNDGIVRPHKRNFLSKIPDWLLSIILPAIFFLGLTIGKYVSDLQNIELKRENNELRNLPITIPSDTITDKAKDSAYYPQN